MAAIRIIPRLDIKAPNLVKGIRLEGLRKLGSPKDFAKRYFEGGADEILYQDIVASLYERNSLENLVYETVQDVFVPISVGGGLRTTDDIQKLLRSGADKISVNTAATKDPSFIGQAAQVFGSQCITVAVETIRQPNGHWLAFTDNGREHTGRDALDWALQAVEAGAGELLLTSVDKEGTGGGFDCEFIRQVVDGVGVPVIAHGGAGSLDHILEVADCGVDGIAVAQLLHYDKMTIATIKAALLQAGFEVRP